jgi:hypothetical protein
MRVSVELTWSKAVRQTIFPSLSWLYLFGKRA